MYYKINKLFLFWRVSHIFLLKFNFLTTILDSPVNLSGYDSTNDSISLRWETPKYDGGHKIAGYDVEKRNLPSKNWVKCNVGNISSTEFKVDICFLIFNILTSSI